MCCFNVFFLRTDMGLHVYSCSKNVTFDCNHFVPTSTLQNYHNKPHAYNSLKALENQRHFHRIS